MAKKTKSDETPEEGTAKSGRLKLIIAAVVLVVAGAVVGSKVLGGGASPAEAMGPTSTTTEPPGSVTSVDAITLNLADGRFLKLGLAFEVRDGETYPSDADMTGDETTKGFAREVDAAITIMSSYTYEQLIAPDGKQIAKRTLLEKVQQISDDAVKDILFHEFVMQ